eukprot:m.143490 g.143490  ORF g.143490 m.143490 type:complete len:510 (+) comp14898_c0_seq6:334-1863(+)
MSAQTDPTLLAPPTRGKSIRADSVSSDIFERDGKGRTIDDILGVRVRFHDPNDHSIAAGTAEPTNNQPFVTYIIEVIRGSGSEEKKWEIVKRYSEFDELNKQILAETGIALKLPPKKMFGNKDRDFIAKRRAGLQDYMSQICKDPVLRFSLPFLRFIDKTKYSALVKEDYFRGASIFARNDLQWDLHAALGQTGWRYRKGGFLFTEKSTGTKRMLTWCPLLEKVSISRELLGRCVHYLGQIEHPNIMPSLFSDFFDTEGGAAVVIREVFPLGSLKDKIYGCQAPLKLPYSKKYSRVPGTTPQGLPAQEVAKYGRSILEGLIFLQDKGIPYGHLHSGNVLMKQDGGCMLSDLENAVLGYSSYYSNYMGNLPKIDTMQKQNAYCFGHTLYEMGFGATLTEPTNDFIPAHLPGHAVLTQILTAEGVKSLPSLQSLVDNDFFKHQLGVPAGVKTSFKASARVREALKTTWKANEETLHKRQQEEEQLRKQKKLEEDKEARERRKAQERQRTVR